MVKVTHRQLTRSLEDQIVSYLVAVNSTSSIKMAKSVFVALLLVAAIGCSQAILLKKLLLPTIDLICSLAQATELATALYIPDDTPTAYYLPEPLIFIIITITPFQCLNRT